jgi:hypothetical protein
LLAALALRNTYMFHMADTRIKKSPEQKLAEASEGLADYRAREAAKHKNMLRLRAERLAREAASPPAIESGLPSPLLDERPFVIHESPGRPLGLAIAPDRAHKRACLKRTIERAPAARFTTVPSRWLPAGKSAASNALFAEQPWKPGIRRGCPPIAWLQIR